MARWAAMHSRRPKSYVLALLYDDLQAYGRTRLRIMVVKFLIGQATIAFVGARMRRPNGQTAHLTLVGSR